MILSFDSCNLNLNENLKTGVCGSFSCSEQDVVFGDKMCLFKIGHCHCHPACVTEIEDVYTG